MLFLMLGIVLVALKYLEFGAIGMWSWWVVLAPFGLAVAWWAWADATGYTKKKAMEKMEQRKQDRIDKQREGMGVLPRKRK